MTKENNKKDTVNTNNKKKKKKKKNVNWGSRIFAIIMLILMLCSIVASVLVYV